MMSFRAHVEAVLRSLTAVAPSSIPKEVRKHDQMIIKTATLAQLLLLLRL